MQTAHTSLHGDSFRRNSARVLGASGMAVALGGSLMFASPALASASCPDGATLLSNGSCQVAFTESGSFTPPAGASNIEALLVGAGGSGVGYYGGGGGDVRIVDLADSGDVTVTVGIGGTYDNGDDGTGETTSVVQGATTEDANGGTGLISYAGGTSGNGNAAISYASGGSGAGASATNNNGGDGVVVSSLDSMHFTDDDSCFGGGGSGYTFNTDTSATCGGGYVTDIVHNTADVNLLNTWLPNTGSANNVFPESNSGGGGMAAMSFTDNSLFTPYGANGADGYVELRFDYTAPGAPSAAPAALATTGSAALPLGVLSLGLGMTGAALALARRARRSA